MSKKTKRVTRQQESSSGLPRRGGESGVDKAPEEKMRRSKWDLVAALMVLTFLIVAFFTSGDYGVAWDESTQRAIGTANAEFLAGRPAALDALKDKDYGPIFEVLLAPLEALGNETLINRLRHLATHLVFLAGAVAFYVLLRQHFGSPSLALVGLCMLLFHPHIYGHSFFNSKDVPAMSLWIGGLLATALWLRSPARWTLVAAAIVLALLTNLRLVGLIPAGFFLLAIVWTAVSRRRTPATAALDAAIFFGVFAAVLVLTWPYLWSNPLGQLLEVARSASKFRWDGFVLFHGVPMEANQLPFYYLPLWIVATTPPVQTVLAAAGCIVVAARTFGDRCWKEPGRVFEVMVLSTLAGCVGAVFILKPVIYDGWRHFFFLYPFLVFLGVVGLGALLDFLSRKSNAAVGAAWGLVWTSLVASACWMVYAHPLQHVYFNELVARKDKPIWSRMERDYWGTSMKIALDWLATLPGEPAIRVSGWPIEALQKNHAILPEEVRRRIVVVSLEEPHQYFITNWRGIVTSEGSGTQVFRVCLNDSEVVSVFKRP